MVASANYTEKELLQQLAAGNEEAFNRIYHEYYPLLFQHAFTMLKIKPIAEDTCHETFLNLWKNRQNLATVGCLKAYLFTSARNHSLNALKKLSRKCGTAEEIALTFPDKSFSSELPLLDKEYAAFIQKGINQLPTRAKEVFLLCRHQGFSYNEVAAQLGISRNAVKHHMVFSIKKLASMAKKQLGVSSLLCLVFSLF